MCLRRLCFWTTTAALFASCEAKERETEGTALAADAASPDAARAEGPDAAGGQMASDAPPAVVLPIVSVNDTWQEVPYGEWQARWWQWALMTPMAGASHPFLPEGDVSLGQNDEVWFLNGLPRDEDAPGGPARSIDVGPATALFFPLVNAECSEIEPPESGHHGDTEEDRRACANGWMDLVTGLAAELDGTPVPDLFDYRTQSPEFPVGPLPAENVLGAPEGTITQAVDVGFYLLVAPLAPGEHTLHFRADLSTEPPEIREATYHIAVRAD